MTKAAKKYYWLKLKEDFFEDDTIEWIEEQPNGERYSLFYLKLCLKSLKTDGILIRNVGDMLIPYDIKKLAEITRTDIDTARVAMELFKNIGLVQILENGEIYMTQLQNMVGSETSKAQLMRNKRARDKEKALPQPKNEDGNNVTDALPKRYTETETEQEKEIEKEIEIEKEPTDRQREREEEPPAELNPRQQERVELLRDLFDSWTINDNQIFHLSSLINSKIPYDPLLGVHGVELKIYDYLQDLTYRAKSYDVKHIYNWMLKVIPEVEFEN